MFGTPLSVLQKLCLILNKSCKLLVYKKSILYFITFREKRVVSWLLYGCCYDVGREKEGNKVPRSGHYGINCCALSGPLI